MIDNTIILRNLSVSSGIGSGFEKLAVLGASFMLLLLLAVIWEMIWKGIAMWKAARNGHKVWFVCILILNTLGILPIIYLLLYPSKKGRKR